MSEMTPADVAAVTDGRYGGYGNGLFGNEGIWLFAILALMWGGNGFLGGRGNAFPTDYARQSDVVYTSAFNQLQDENRALAAEIQRTGYDNMSVVKDVAYNNLSEIRDLEGTVNVGFANQAKCCCETLRAIDGVNYNLASQSAAIQATSTANTQKVLDALTQNRFEAMQARINALELDKATSGLVRYPQSMTYNAGYSPFCYNYNGTTCSSI